MSKPKFKILDCGVYPYDVLFAVGASEEEVTKYLKAKCKYKLDDEERGHLRFSGKGGRTVRFKNNALLIWVKTDYLPVIAHEIFHGVELLMEKINTPLNESTSEPYAYLIEYLWKQSLPVIKKTWVT